MSSPLCILSVLLIAASYPANLWGDPAFGPVPPPSHPEERSDERSLALQRDPPPAARHDGLPRSPRLDSLPQWERWADSVLATLSLRAKVAQMLLRPVPATTDGAAATEGPEVRRWIMEDSLGGFILPIGPSAQVARSTNTLQRLAPVPLLLATDVEMSPRQRVVPGSGHFPLLLALAAASAGTAGCDYGRITARMARAIGLHWILASPADTGRRTGVPRSDPARIAEAFARPFVRCADEDGLIASLRPDPGSGDTLSVLDARGVQGGAETRAVRAAAPAIAAGADLLLVDRDHRLVIQAITAAVRDARLTEARIDSSVRQLLILKARLGLGRDPPVDAEQAEHRVAILQTDTFPANLARRSIVLARDRPALVPIDTARVRRVLVVAWLGAGIEPVPAGSPSETFVSELRALLEPRGVVVENAVTTSATAADRYATLVSRAAAADLVVLAPFVRPDGNQGTTALPAAAARFFARALARQPRTIIVSFGGPRMVRQLPATGSYLIAWNPWSSEAERSAAHMLAGVTPITGRLPVTLGARMPRGAGIAMQAVHPPERTVSRDEATIVILRDTLQRFLDQAVRDSAFPGAVAVVGNADGILASASAGTLDWTPSPRPDMGTLWDIASLTKVVGLTTAVMRLVEAGTISLEHPVQRYLPEWTGRGKERVTVRDLLTHTTGLPAFRRLFLETTDRDTLLAMVVETPLDTVPGARMVYSDFGLILAGMIVERVTKEPLDRHLARTIFEPLGMHETLYRPPPGLLARVAPTEFDPWRGVQVRGEVHDENTAAMGGVSSHAGLFSTARDLSRFARMYLNRGTLDGVRLVSPRTIALFTRAQDPALSHRALGWETPNGVNSAGHRLSPAAFGHTGFTGTSLWIDPVNDVFVLLLSNRVNPSRENRRVYDLRGLLADTVMDVLAPTLPALAAAPPSPPTP